MHRINVVIATSSLVLSMVAICGIAWERWASASA